MIGSHLRPGPCPVSISWWVMFWHPKQRNQPWQLQTRQRALLKDLWGVAEPWFGTIADVTIAIWGKEAGVGWRRLILFMLVVWEPKTNPKKTWKFPSRRKILLSNVDLYPLWVTFLCNLWVLGVLLCTIKNITKYLSCAKTLYRFLLCASISGTFCVILVTFPR